MKLVIENKALNRRQRKLDSGEFRQFVVSLCALGPGQSFRVQAIPSNYRTAISTVQTALGRAFATERDGRQYRVGRVT